MALELASKRRFRAEDGVALPGLLPSGGGPAAMFDPKIGKLALASAKALLGHVTRRPSWRSRKTRPWPGSRWPVRPRCST